MPVACKRGYIYKMMSVYNLHMIDCNFEVQLSIAVRVLILHHDIHLQIFGSVFAGLFKSRARRRKLWCGPCGLANQAVLLMSGQGYIKIKQCHCHSSSGSIIVIMLETGECHHKQVSHV